MGRIRTVKPALFTHGDLFDAEQESGLPLRVAFIALFTCCDREGRFRWKPRELKLDCLPFDQVDFSRVLDALWTRGFLVKYALNGAEYGCIPTFPKHQVINNRESLSELPEPTEATVVTREPRVDDATTTRLIPAQVEGKGREGNMEGEGNMESRVNDVSTVVEQPLELPVALFPVIQSHQPPSPVVEVVTAEVWPTFDDWWNLYGHKIDRGTCARRWAGMTQAEREQCMRHTTAYVAVTATDQSKEPEKKPRRNPLTYLNGKNFNEDALLIPRTTYANGNSRPGTTATLGEAATIAQGLAILEQRATGAPPADGNAAGHPDGRG